MNRIVREEKVILSKTHNYIEYCKTLKIGRKEENKNRHLLLYIGTNKKKNEKLVDTEIKHV